MKKKVKRNMSDRQLPDIAQYQLSDNRPRPATWINRRIWNDVKEMMFSHK